MCHIFVTHLQHVAMIHTHIPLHNRVQKLAPSLELISHRFLPTASAPTGAFNGAVKLLLATDPSPSQQPLTVNPTTTTSKTSKIA